MLYWFRGSNFLLTMSFRAILSCVLIAQHFTGLAVSMITDACLHNLVGQMRRRDAQKSWGVQEYAAGKATGDSLSALPTPASEVRNIYNSATLT